MTKIKNIPSALFSFWVLLLTQATTLATNEENTRVNSSCLPGERAALLTLKASFADPKHRLSSWKGHDCCSWSSVTCSKMTGHVMKLDLSNTYMTNDPELDPFPDYNYAMGGEIRSSLLYLRYLNYLDLSYNNFSNAKMPHFIGSLKKLKYLNLSSSHFGGRIPPQLGNLSNLQYLDLSSNEFNGNIPPQLSNLSNLQYLDLSSNKFNGNIPFQLGNLSNLQYLDLSSNLIYSNDIAWLARLTSLKHLDLSSANLSNSINWERLGMLCHLQELYLSSCELNETRFSLSHVNFTKLSTFELSGNWFSNPQSLIWVWNMTGLRSVDFSYNNFDGRIFNALRNMNSIEELHLDWNNLMDMKSTDVKNLTNLKILKLSGNQLTKDITMFMEDFSQHRLQYLDLGWNNFYRNLFGWIGRMTGLTNLWLDGNNLSGSIPLSIRRLTQLIKLVLSENNFNGVVTEKHLSKMTNLKTIDLSGNSLSLIVAANWLPPFRLRDAFFSSCRLGPEFPVWLKLQTNIVSVDISNTSIADEVPIWFWQVISKAFYLNLSKNNLSGLMPESLEFMSATFLSLSENQFQGLVPKLPKSLVALDLSGNALSSFLPSNWENLNLGALNLRQNSLKGSIPPFICQLKNLQFLDLSHNFLVGNIPNCGRSNPDSCQNNYSRQGSSTNQSFVEQKYYYKLTSLFLSYNNLSGEFPKHLTCFSSLNVINLGNNNFFGSIPPWIMEKLPSLRLLLLGSNRFNGTIPNQLFQLEQLQILDLSNNNLSGIVPCSMRTLTTMTITHEIDIGQGASDQIIGMSLSFFIEYQLWTFIEVDTKGVPLDFNPKILDFTSFDLSGNNLVGNIPEEIGALDGLINLNLSRNKLSGFIPRSIGNLRSLESLDFSNNELSGSIPPSLADLTFLSHLNMSYNNLSGRIPSGRQLQTLNDQSIYEGNNDLCGFTLPIECSGSKITSQSFVFENKNSHEFYVGAIIIGFAVGAWMVYAALLFNKSCRVAYFVFFDNMYDRLYQNYAEIKKKPVTRKMY